MSDLDALQDDDPSLLRRLRAENARLRAELADATWRLARDRDTVDLLGRSIDWLKQQERLTIPPWTHDRPTAPGWYWLASDILFDDPSIVNVRTHDGELAIRGDRGTQHIAELADTALWSGPISKPPYMNRGSHMEENLSDKGARLPR